MQPLGLDLGLTGTGWAYPDGQSGVICIPGDGPERIHLILLRLIETGLLIAPLVAIEGYSFGSRHRAHQVGELGGVIRYTLWKEERPYVEVSPRSLKKFVGGKGNLKKDEMRLEVYKRWKKEFKTEHEVDAFGLAMIAEALTNDSGRKLTKPQKEVLEALTGAKLVSRDELKKIVKSQKEGRE